MINRIESIVAVPNSQDASAVILGRDSMGNWWVANSNNLAVADAWKPLPNLPTTNVDRSQMGLQA